MDSLESLFSLRGHRGLVTGASSGLGVECAKALAIAGADVALVARRKDRVTRIADELAHAHGVKTIGIGADVTREADLDRAMAEAAAALGDVDILVNNAGVSPTGRAENFKREAWDETHRGESDRADDALAAGRARASSRSNSPAGSSTWFRSTRRSRVRFIGCRHTRRPRRRWRI